MPTLTNQATILGRLGNVDLWGGRIEDSRVHYVAGLTIARDIGARLLEGRLCGNFAIAHQEQGRTREAVAHYEAALEIWHELGSGSRVRRSLVLYCRRVRARTSGNTRARFRPSC